VIQRKAEYERRPEVIAKRREYNSQRQRQKAELELLAIKAKLSRTP